MQSLPNCPGVFATVTVTRSGAGSYINGRWAAGVASQFSISASIQPAKMKHEELLHLPEGDRNRSALRVYTPTELRSANEADGTPADFIAWDGEQWEVVKVDVWTLGIAHCKALALRVRRA